MSNGKQPKAGTEQRRSVQKEARDFRRFIEESFPIKEVGEASAREKTIRHSHISTLHIWWSRKPLAVSRAIAYAAMTPVSKDTEEWQKKRDFIIQLCQWENSNNQSLLERARREILEANGGVPPKVLDPFSGGGSFPLEAMRLGCESYANDYNPVAVLIEKATLEYPQKFGRPFKGMPDWSKSSHSSKAGSKKKKGRETQPDLFSQSEIENQQSALENPLLNGVRYWGNWVLEETQKELGKFYPLDSNESIPVGYIWVYTIPCQNPSCRIQIPLKNQWQLVKKAKKRVAIFPQVKKNKVEYKIVGDGYEPWPEDFDPEKGTVSRGAVTCPNCETVVEKELTRRFFVENQVKHQLIGVVFKNTTRTGKTYRVAGEADIEVFKKSQAELKSKRDKLILEWGTDPVPDELIKRVPIAFGSINVWVYGMDNWGKLFNDRQLLALICFSEKIRLAHNLILQNNDNPEFGDAIITYMGLLLSKLADWMSVLTGWQPLVQCPSHTFTRQGLGMMWDYHEVAPLGGSSGSWKSLLKVFYDALETCFVSSNPATVTQSSATSLPYPNDYYDVVLTDPPYYDLVPYSYLSDFFYVWLKRSLGNVHPQLFSTPLSPKSGEIVAYSQSDNDYASGKDFFESNLKKSFQEIYRTLKPNGVAVIVYAYKTTAGWETLINSLIDSGLVVTGAWPINTEMQSRLRSHDSATLSSSIYIIARKMPRQPTGFYNDVRGELTQHLDTKLHRLWEEGIGGGDFFIAAIGSAIEIFGKYEQVMDFEGNIVRADRLLEEVRALATNYAVKQILHDEFVTEVSPIARFYVLWRWNYGEALVPFDEANKLAHSCGLDLSLQFGKNGFIKKEKEFARLLGPQGRKLDDLDDPRDMIDVLHKSLLLWEKGQRAEMVKALSDRGFGKSEAFYRVAQAISETLPLESKEKKLLDGFLAGRDRVQQEVEKEASQERLL